MIKIHGFVYSEMTFDFLLMHECQINHTDACSLQLVCVRSGVKLTSSLPSIVTDTHSSLCPLTPSSPCSVAMEARGKFDFSATAEDELSFRKGDILKV